MVFRSQSSQGNGINWGAVGVVLTAAAMFLAGARSLNANTVEVENLKENYRSVIKQRESDQREVRDELREIRRTVNSIWQQINSQQ